MVLGMSYDVNTSSLGRMTSGSNSFEISLSFTKEKGGKDPRNGIRLSKTINA